MSEVKVEIKADTSMLATGLAKAQKNIQNFGKDVTTNITDKLAGAFSGAAVLGGIGAIATGVIAFGKSIIDFAGNLQDTSEQLGITVEQLQGLHAAFRGGGASAEDVDKAMIKLTQNMDEATKSTGPIRDRFDQLGISFAKISSGNTGDVLLAIGDAAKNTQNPVETLAAIIDLLGKSGKKLVPDLKQGSEALEEISRKADKISNTDNDKMAKFGDEMTELGTTAKSTGVDLYNWFSSVADGFSRFTGSLSGSDAMLDTLRKKAIAAADAQKALADAAKKAADDAIPQDAKDFMANNLATGSGPYFEDPKIKAAAEAQAKMDEENQKKADAYAAKQQTEADKLAAIQVSNAEEIEKQRRDQLDTEGQINALLEDRKNLQSEIASNSGMQKAQAEKDLIAVEKDLATAKDKAKKDMAAEGDEREKNNAADMKKKEDAAKKKKDLAEADVKGKEELAAQKKAGEEKRGSILDQMVDEEMKTPMQRANEDRVARERERIKGSLERRMKSAVNRPGASKLMDKLSLELKNLDEKELPAEVKALTKKLDEVVNKINKG
jgi:hypothetical protein